MNPMLKYGKDSSRFLQIEFIGGPCDGHLEIRYAQVRSLPKSVIWVVVENVYRLLERQDLRQPDGIASPLTSVALYSLQRANGKNVYRYSCSVSIDRLREGLND